ncbi:hypothetical protein N8D56_18870 [Devosia sp. A8/3-2]|nr:hypothetical protein N8D56_18870 [Devosia sp. A8/3-2]
MAMIDTIFEWLDRGAEKSSRRIARGTGRRSFLTKAGAAMLGGGLLPMLPFDRNFGRAFAREGASPDGDQTSCDYWRYCALDGNLCNECGGTLNQCPPGSEASKVSWVGTCLQSQ